MPVSMLVNGGDPAWALPSRSCQGPGGEGDCDSPAHHGSDIAWGVALQGYKHSSTQGPWKNVGSWVEECPQQRKQHVDSSGG